MGQTLLAAMTANVRTDLKDLDSTAYYWADSEIQRHIQHAVNDFQEILPLVDALSVTAAADGSGNTRRLPSLAAQTGYLYTLRVEYPIDNDPPIYRAFREETPGVNYLITGDPPLAGDSLKLWYAQTHTLSTLTSTIPTTYEELLTLGAVAYAAQAGDRYAQGRLNPSIWTPRGLAEFATERMAAYQSALDTLRVSASPGPVPTIQWGEVPTDWQRL